MKKERSLVSHQHVGIIKVKRAILLISLSGIVISNAHAFQKQPRFANASHVDMKCYVELLGGGVTIRRNYDVPVEKAKNFRATLKRIDEQVKSANQTKKIYRILECKEISKEFKNEAAAKLDKNEKEEG